VLQSDFRGRNCVTFVTPHLRRGGQTRGASQRLMPMFIIVTSPLHSGRAPMEKLAAGHDAAVQMIDTSVVRVHQHGACVADNNHQNVGR
jgi:hypothetical protein